jgi:hypothetical protein
VGDTAITAAVKTALAADPSLSALHIDVTTTHGSVLLAGPAPDAKSRQRAEVLAMAPEGVVAVDNRLVVAPTRPSSPTPAPAMPAAKLTPASRPAPIPEETRKAPEPPAATEAAPAPAPTTAGTPPAE